MERRSFLVFLAAIPALNLISGSGESDSQRFIRLARTGLIKSESFVIDRPTLVSTNELTVLDCQFEFKDGGYIKVFSNNVNMVSNVMEYK
jgi:hypothetical protein